MAQYYQRLTEMRHELPVHLQAKVVCVLYYSISIQPYSVIFLDSLSSLLHTQLTNDYVMEICLSLQDGTVFDIVKELEEIQQLNERSLLNRRMKVKTNTMNLIFTNSIDSRFTQETTHGHDSTSQRRASRMSAP